MKKRVEVPIQQDNGMSKVKMINDTKVRFSEMSEMASHLYKLVEASVIKFIGKGTGKNESPDTTPENFLEMGHAHVFRTLDTDGNKHTRSVAIAGHYHLLELEYDKNDPEAAPKIVAMSGPMQLVTKKVKGRTVQVDEPLNDYDYHTHDIAYVKSEKIQARTVNKEAKEFIANQSAKVPQAPAGVR